MDDIRKLNDEEIPLDLDSDDTETGETEEKGKNGSVKDLSEGKK